MATFRKRSGKWNARIQRKGYPDISKTFATQADAKAWAKRIEVEIERGLFVDRTEAENNTLGDILKRYKRDVSPLKKSGPIEAIRINRFIREEKKLCSYMAAALSGKLLAEWRDKRLKEVSGSSVNRELNLISHALNIARKEWDIHIDNPVTLIQRPKSNKSRERRLSCQEEQALLRQMELVIRSPKGTFEANGTQNPWLAPITVIALETGMRMSEIVSLSWSNVDLVRCTATLQDTKNGERRVVPLSQKARATLLALPKAIDGRVFFTSREAVKRGFSRAVGRAKIEDLHFHDLRHEATSRLFERGLNIMEVAAITGHKSLSMLKRYTHLKAEDLAKKLG